MSDKVEMVTVYRGKDSATYLASDFEKYGEAAEPLYVRQDPSKDGAWVNILHGDTDTVRFFAEEPIRQDSGNGLAKWDVKALKSLLESAPDHPKETP